MSEQSTTAPVVELVRFGEIVRIGNGTWMIANHCGAGAGRAMACVTCNVETPNRDAMAAHVREPGTHRLVSHCPTHKWWETVPPRKEDPSQ